MPRITDVAILESIVVQVYVDAQVWYDGLWVWLRIWLRRWRVQVLIHLEHEFAVFNVRVLGIKG